MKKLPLIVLAVCGVACSREQDEPSASIPPSPVQKAVKQQVDKDAFVIDSFLGYKFGEKAPEGDNEVFENLAKPFRCFYRVRKNYSRDGKLYKLLFFGKNDKWSVKDFNAETVKVANLISEKYDIKVSIIDALVTMAVYENANVSIRIEPNLRGMEMTVTSKKILREGSEKNSLSANLDADML